MYDGECLEFGHYVNDMFDANTGICWHGDDTKITQISDLLEWVYIRKSQKDIYKVMLGPKNVCIMVLS